MTGRLAGRTILVTGGGSGIGRGVVDAYVAEGARLTVLERSADAAAELEKEYGDAVSVVPGDATDVEAVEKAVAAAIGDAGLDHLTCCVGVFDYYASIRELEPDDIATAAGEIWRTNVLSTLLAINIAYPWLRSARGSATLTLSASAFYPEGGGVLYGSSKWALRGVVAHLAKDLAPEVRVNGVAPGGTSGTRLGGLDSLGQEMTADRVAGRDDQIRAGSALEVVPRPEDHAGAYVYLADPAAARVVTGVVVNTDGGRI
ncbi:SDR family NAD(P)-dependent oxidoreductase [Actinobacteria bacterium YIM 96077]|uniref:3-(Cis-5,6-dihydroxycyclohexa-1, 3-dien-1-yl)propanoate dehydrogenase n=1 Tax=Phytoactinopolyspora halophila TaxID=1981511 RepID=A0A329QTU7_9ACTN|nr:SDR family NAD(P)-dependent oxidoreductase [Phytoactinopolyspora halophila]AYY15004.1 SDR family NAD(P)-dependent oxidoreductase [Actinobacteria bacterium YIM 96077]RAW15461.1 3-(cis-5,6-dihydroxycyclohexa-1,3-dien-1-yl)propanoate dehydrogenase [Phytoactinopolyspora halophila]